MTAGRLVFEGTGEISEFEGGIHHWSQTRVFECVDHVELIAPASDKESPDSHLPRECQPERHRGSHTAEDTDQRNTPAHRSGDHGLLESLGSSDLDHVVGRSPLSEDIVNTGS